MATLRIPDKNVTLRDPSAVRQFLDMRGIVHERWSADRDLPSGATNEYVLAAYDYLLKPLMDKGDCQMADVVSVDENTPNLAGIREKFRREHTHSEDEARVFVKAKAFLGSTRKSATMKSSPCCASKAISLLSRPTQSTGST